MPNPKKSSRSILIVDDEENFLFAMKTWLSAKGYEVQTASNGMEALAKLKARKPDMMFLDVSMPGMDGIDTLAQVRDMHEDLPVIMITAFGLVPRLEEAQKYGVTGIFRKSQDFGKAAELIESAVQKIDET